MSAMQGWLAGEGNTRVYVCKVLIVKEREDGRDGWKMTGQHELNSPQQCRCTWTGLQTGLVEM